MDFLDVKEWGSKLELELFLKEREHAIQVGWDRENVRRFYSVTIEKTVGYLEVGILAAHHGLKPACIRAASLPYIVIGSDSDIFIIDVENEKSIDSIKLTGVFLDFFEFNSYTDVFILHELGILRVNLSGEVIWNVDTDVITNYKIEGRSLLIDVMDNPNTLCIDMLSGKIN